MRNPNETLCDYCGLPVPGPSSAHNEPAYCCYGCRLAARITRSRGAEGENKLTLTLLGIAIFLSMNVMVVNWMLYGQEVFNPGGAPPTALAATTISIFQYLSLMLTAPVLVILGWPIARDSIVALRTGIVNSDALIVLGVAAAFVLSYINVLRGHGGTYFDTVCMILVLFTAGRYLEAGAKLRATESLKSLDTLLPGHARVVRGDEIELVATDVVEIGDVVEIQPGARSPVDGVVIANTSMFDEQLVTGESQPRFKDIGDHVYAGAMNGGGCVRLRAIAVRADTVLAGIKELLIEARRSKGHFQRMADRVAAILTPAITVGAIAVAVWTTRTTGFDDGVMRGLSMLLIACPCALGLATPLAVWASLNRAASRQALIRNVCALERLANVRTVFFDKTGTLTEGDARVRNVIADDGAPDSMRRALAIAAGLGGQTNHHFAAAIGRYADDQGIRAISIDNAVTTPGMGVEGVTHDGETAVYLGSLAYLRQRGIGIAEQGQHAIDVCIGAGDAISCVGWDGQVRAAFTFDESLKPQAVETIAVLQRHGFRVSVLTGDHQRRAELLSERLGIAVEGPLLPAEKADRVRSASTKSGGVLMIGDGINDAPALAAADVGVALACGADVSREAADICLLNSDLATLPWLVDLSRRTVRTIRGNLIWAFAYNVVGLGLAATGRLTPLFSALAMVASSTLVVANSMRLMREPGGEATESVPVQSELEVAA